MPASYSPAKRNEFGGDFHLDDLFGHNDHPTDSNVNEPGHVDRPSNSNAAKEDPVGGDNSATDAEDGGGGDGSDGTGGNMNTPDWSENGWPSLPNVVQSQKTNILTL